jgi:P2 family phage contractile tail tube protein
MVAPVEIDMGLEKMEASVTFAEYDPDLFALFGLADGSSTAMTIRGFIAEGGDSLERLVSLRGLVKELDSGSWKAGEKGSLKMTMAVRYYKDTIGGREIAEVDVENMVRRIDGVDQLAEIRSALGL